MTSAVAAARLSPQVKGTGITVAGVLIVSPDALLVRLSHADPWTVVAIRSTLTTITIAALLTLAARREGSAVRRAFRTVGRPGLGVAVLWAANGPLFVISVTETEAANTLVILSAAPLVAAGLSHVVGADRIPVGTWMVTLIALVTTTAVVTDGVGAGRWLGNAAAVGCTVTMATSLVVIRQHRIAMLPSLAIAHLLAAAVTVAWCDLDGITAGEATALIVDGLVVVPIALALITTGPRYIPAPDVALIGLLETVFSPIWVWLAIGEVPRATTAIGGGILVTALAVHAFMQIERSRRGVTNTRTTATGKSSAVSTIGALGSPSYGVAVTTEPTFANNLATEREAVGIGSAEELAHRVEIEPSVYALIEAGEVLPTKAEFWRLIEQLGVEPERLYPFGLLGAVGGAGGAYAVPGEVGAFYRGMRDPTRLLVSPDDMAWLERAVEPDGQHDVFVNLSCSAQEVPHLILDTLAVLRKLGIDFAAGSGSDFCCGGYFRIHGSFRAGVRMTERNEGPVLARGATTHVHQCTQCVNNYIATDARSEAEGGGTTPLRHVQVLRFLAERLEELGDEVPWERSADRKVLVHGHLGESPVTTGTMHDVSRVLQLVPGVEVVGVLEPTFMDSFCYTGTDRAYPASPEEMQATRHEIAAIVRAHGADTLAPQSQDCQIWWAPFASVDMAIRNPMSIVAEAMGCDHPDRAQAAALLGDPDAVVEQTRPIWTAWGLTEDKARDIAHRKYNPAAAARVVGCSCGRGGCGSEVGDIDVLKGVDWESAVSVAGRGAT
jgi:drug/metabolite transporter (DMT)-like permease